ncbi:PLU-1-like protein-domain-containing protein [Phycomyces nitens]|nr:PLU-1-like protein-domain-containing protein [Phycomyces nitens]
MRPTTRHKISSDQSSLNLSSVPMTSHYVPRTRPRLFGLTEAPIYYPTPLEFSDPIKYIASIQKEGEKYGIIKIVPPAGYDPGFKLNKETFRFRTRIQKLNSMEGETRANVNYLEQLSNFHISAGTPIHKIPQLDKRPIDLFKLKKEVARRGGYHIVTGQKKWAEIGRSLDYHRKECTSMSNALKNAYYRYVLPYEDWLMSYKSEHGQESPTAEVPVRMKSTRALESREIAAVSQVSDDLEEPCQICHSEDESDMVACEGCGNIFHLYCLSPPLKSMPQGDWHCIKCLTAAGGDYGFEDGDEYSLAGFHQKCKAFKREWFEKNGKLQPDDTVTEEDCEDEFWRLAENPHETCQVEYGADLHSTQHGSALGDLNDPWNLNVIPALPKSLFSHIQADISGMMVPWLYIGMCFSAFCWHNEDHYTYSINYMHWGETKTWYGIPGSDTAKFEETMRKAVPELFEQQPDLLFQLVTMLSPGRLLEENVKVYAVDQRPGQFVVTFPKSYHSGFNHGFNFCEAVNFAPSEWVDLGLECVQRYKEYRRQPCFSHDELLVNVAEHDKSVETAKWLRKAIVAMKNREISERDALRAQQPGLEEIIDTRPQVTDNESQCVYCHCYSYLSHVSCSCTDNIVCLEHYDELCACDVSKKSLCLRFTDEQLVKISQRSPDVTKASLEWSLKYKTIKNGPPPTLKALRSLLNEGEKVSAPEDELEEIRDTIPKIVDWIDQAKRYAIRKHHNRRRDSGPTRFDGERFQQIKQLCKDASEMHFDAPEVHAIRKTLKILNDFRDHALGVLESDNKSGSLDVCREVYEIGTGMNADIPEMARLEIAIKQHMWRKGAPTSIKNHFSDITRSLAEAKEYKIPVDDHIYQTLLGLKLEGERWAAQYDVITDAKSASLDHYRNLLEASAKVPTIPDTLYNVKEVVKAGTEATEIIRLAIKHSTGRQEDKPSTADLARIVQALQWLPIKIDDSHHINSQKEQADNWIRQAEAVFDETSQQTLSQKSALDIRLMSVLTNLINITEPKDSISTAFIASFGGNGRGASTGPLKKARLLNSSADQYCICRKAESGLMIECDICHEWYHGLCVKVTRREARAQTYVCPICDGSQTIPRSSKRPSLEECEQLVEDAKILWFVPKEYDILSRIVGLAQVFKGRVQAFCRSKTHLGVQDLGEIKANLRKLEGLEIHLRDETDFLRKKVQTLSIPPPAQPLYGAYPSPHIPPPQTSQDIPTDPTMPHSPSSADERVYCVCRKRYTPNGPDAHMVGCDTCHEWFHLSCVNLELKALPGIEHYKCPACTQEQQQSLGHHHRSPHMDLKGYAYNTESVVLPTPPLPPAHLPRTPTVIKLTVRPPAPTQTTGLYERKRKHVSDHLTEKEKSKRDLSMNEDVYLHASV